MIKRLTNRGKCKCTIARMTRNLEICHYILTDPGLRAHTDKADVALAHLVWDRLLRYRNELRR